MLTFDEFRLGGKLVRAGMISEIRLAEAAKLLEADDGLSLREILVEHEDLTEEELLDFTATLRMDWRSSIVDAVTADGVGKHSD